MRPSQQLAFPDKTLTPSSGQSAEISGGFVSRMVLTVSGGITQPATAGVSRSGVVGLLGDVKITQNGSTLFSCQATDLLQGFEVFTGGTIDAIDSEALNPTAVAGNLDMNWGAIMKGSGLDASGQNRCGYRVDSSPANRYKSDATDYSLNLRGHVEHDGGVAVGPYLVPRLVQKFVPLVGPSTQHYDEFVAPADGFLLGVQIRPIDAGGAVRNEWSDGLIKRAKIRHVSTGGSGSSELFEGTWRQLRNLTRSRWRVPSIKLTNLGAVDDGLENGLAIFPTFDRTAPSGAMRMRRNEKIQVYMDSSGTAEVGYANVIPGGNDSCALTFWFFQPTNAGAADRAQQGVSASTPTASRVARAAVNGGRRRTRFFGG